MLPPITPPTVTAEVTILALLFNVISLKQAPDVNLVIVIFLVPTAVKPVNAKVPWPAVVTVIAILKLF
ncbi:hypothetical protein D3C87_1757760 [compost metagenome]